MCFTFEIVQQRIVTVGHTNDNEQTLVPSVNTNFHQVRVAVGQLVLESTDKPTHEGWNSKVSLELAEQRPPF